MCPTVRWLHAELSCVDNALRNMFAMTFASIASLDIESLVSPFPGDEPGGDSRAYVRDLRPRFAELRNPPISTNPDDPDMGSIGREPDWDSIGELAIESLSKRTKDIRIACHLVESLMHSDGLAGFAAGLSLLGHLLETGWDYLIPQLDPDDLEVRSSPIENLLDDPDRGPCLPMALKALPIIGEGNNRVSLQDVTRRGGSDDDKNKINIAISSCTADAGRELVVRYREASEQLDRIKAVLNDKLGSNAPGLTNLSDSLQLVGRWLISCFGDQGVREKIVDGDAEQSLLDSVNDLASAAQPSNAPRRDHAIIGATEDPASVLKMSIQMRSDAYRKLTEAATVLQQIEPHSPIPYMIHRAVRLGQMPFPDLVGKLVREESALQKLRGEFGLTSDDEN
jgi:type VI secretion system protein ImpA